MGNVVLAIDMIKGFCREQFPLFCGPDSLKIISPIQELLAKETAGGSRIMYLVDSHEKNDREFKMFPPHCIKGTEECDVIPELFDRFPGDKISKSRFSGFYNTDLDDQLKLVTPSKLVVVGVCTDICVLHTVADARNRDYNVEVPVDCVASFDREAHEWAIKHMEKILGAEIIR